MTSYTLVRVAREGRQALDEDVHCVPSDSTETVCGSYNDSEVRTVRTLGIFTGDEIICEECSQKIENVL